MSCTLAAVALTVMAVVMTEQHSRTLGGGAQPGSPRTAPVPKRPFSTL